MGYDNVKLGVQVPPKCLYLPNIHGAITQNTKLTFLYFLKCNSSPFKYCRRSDFNPSSRNFTKRITEHDHTKGNAIPSQ